MGTRRSTALSPGLPASPTFSAALGLSHGRPFRVPRVALLLPESPGLLSNAASRSPQCTPAGREAPSEDCPAAHKGEESRSAERNGPHKGGTEVCLTG